MSCWSPLYCFAAPSYVLEKCLFLLFGVVPNIWSHYGRWSVFWRVTWDLGLCRLEPYIDTTAREWSHLRRVASADAIAGWCILAAAGSSGRAVRHAASAIWTTTFSLNTWLCSCPLHLLHG